MTRSSSEPIPRTTRLAPSPTGALHLGNARTFAVNWALARQRGWKVVLRIDDLDAPRTKPGAVEASIEDLTWLGLTWDDGPVLQSAETAAYRSALDRLKDADHVYPCGCSRQEIARAQSAPHRGEGEPRYPGTCRPAGHRALPAGREVAWRVKAPERPLEFRDRVCGPQRIDVAAQVGDFVVATKAGLPAYQLAVVVDDARQGVTDVVRGDDLLPSAARQLWLYRLLGLEPEPSYWHLPLVLGADGRRLAKRHGDTSLAECRRRGVSAERVVGLLARWSGLGGDAEPMALTRFAELFKLGSLPREPTLCTASDLAWLFDRAQLPLARSGPG